MKSIMSGIWMVVIVLACNSYPVKAQDNPLPFPPAEGPVLLLAPGKESVSEGFVSAKTGLPAKQKTSVAATWRDDRLVFDFRVFDDAVLAAQEGRDNIKLWKDDSVYVWIDPTHAHSAKGGLVMVQVSAGGLVFDQKDNDPAFNIEGLEVKTARNDSGWTAQVGIPFKGLGVEAPKPGDVWGFNFTRMDQPGKVDLNSMESSSLAALQDGDAGNFDAWGHMAFASNEDEESAARSLLDKVHQARIEVLGGAYLRELISDRAKRAEKENRKGQPANPMASEDVHKIVSWLASLPDRETNRFLLCNDIWSYEPAPGNLDAGFDRFVKSIHDRTGKWLPMIHVSYNDPLIPHPVHPFSVKDANRHAIKYWKAGGLVHIHINPVNPWTGKGWGEDKGLANRERIAEVLEPGTDANQAWMAKLDAYAALLGELRDNGVVVLWRPLHEMTFINCYWYDAGATKDREVFRDIWRHMFRYFTYEKKLDNLIWVFGAADVGSWNGPEPMSMYPGDDYVDVVGLSRYGSSVEISKRDYDQFLQTGKPFFFTEFGPGGKEDPAFDNMDLIRAVRGKYPQIISASYWHSWTGVKTAIADCRNVEQLMDDPWVIDRDELDWRATKVDLEKSRSRKVEHKDFIFFEK